MRTLLTNARIVTPHGIVRGGVAIDGLYIESVGEDVCAHSGDSVIDLAGAMVMPGVIDTHVHFREPGMTHKATIASESRAAAAGGVTSVCEMPNCMPTTTTAEALAEKQAIAARDSLVNYAFFVGATHDNTEFLRQVDYSQVPGIKVFMGSSTGGMLVDDDETLRQVFSLSHNIPLVTHCEATDIINRNAKMYGDSHDFAVHPLIRSREACIESTRLAVAMAMECGTRLHVAHLSTKEEIDLVRGRATAEACLPHLLFSDADYERLGARIKCNPAVKTATDRDALWLALEEGIVQTIATDHAPHLLSEKENGGCLTAPSGMPMVQFSLCAMLSQTTPEKVAQWMSHNPAQIFGIEKRGEIREGYYADLAIVQETEPYMIGDNDVVSLCRWTPLAGATLRHRVAATYVNGQKVWDGQSVVHHRAAMPLHFGR